MFVNALLLLVTFLQIGVHATAVATKRAAGPVVRLKYATFEGATMDGVDKFLGMPYAQPPLGDLRFRRPQPPHSVPGTTLVSDLPLFRTAFDLSLFWSFVGHKLRIRLSATELYPAIYPGPQLHRADHVCFESQRI